MDKRTHPNKVCGYLKPKNEAQFKQFVRANDVSESAAVNMIMKEFFAANKKNEDIRKT